MGALATMTAQMGGYYRDHWDSGAHWWMVAMMLLFMLLVVGAIVAAFALVGRSTRTGGAAATGASSSAREILDQRYARGEIDSAEYEERRRMLG